MKKALFLFLILIIFSNYGCYNIRKKFIRKKRRRKEVPVYVDFKDYPKKPSRDVYVNYYLFVKGWLDELRGALAKGVSYKRQKRAADEALMNLERIISFYNAEGKEEIYPLYEELAKIGEEIKLSPNMSEMQGNSLIRKIEYFRRRFERNFNYSDAEKWID